MNRLLIVPGIVVLAGGLYLFFSDTDNSGDAKPGMSISLVEPTPIGPSEIGTTTVTDAVEFKVIPVTIPPAEEPSAKASQAEVVTPDVENSGESELSAQAGLSGGLASSNDNDGNSNDGNSEDAAANGDIEPGRFESDLQPQPSDLVKHEVVIDSSLYQATLAAGLSANQTARIGKIFKPYLDASSELRKGDKLIVILDPAAGEAGNDADQVHRLEYLGARKTLVLTRVEGSLSDYEVEDGGSEMRSDEASSSSRIAEEVPQQSEEPAEVALESAVDNEPAAAGMKRVEGVITVSFFSAAKQAGLNAGQVEMIRKILNPYINFNREMRKGDRFVVMLDGGDVHSCEYIGALKQLLATRDGRGAYKVTDKAGVDITVAESADASSQRHSSRSLLPVITQSESRVKSDAGVQAKSGGKLQKDDKPAAKVARVEKSKSQPNPPVQQLETSKPAVKIAGVEKNNQRQVRQASSKSRDQHSGSRQYNTQQSFWKNLGFGSSGVAGSNWKPKDSKLAKIFDKVSASGKVERKALIRAFKYYQENRKSSGLAQTHIAIADYTKLATTKRLHIINLNTAGVTSVQVAHGRNSGPIGGRVTSTSNANGSNKTTKGFYKVGFKEGRTNKKNLPYLPVQGLESHNRLVGLPPRKGGRDIIIHTAGYVASGGRSLGCFSIRPQDKRLVFNKLKGVLFYSYVG